MVATVKHGIVYVVQHDNPGDASFKKGDRVMMVHSVGTPVKSGEFMHEDGRRVADPYVNPALLAIAEEKEVPVTKTLTDSDLRHGQIYVVLTDHPSASSYVKGDRIKLVPGSEPIDHCFMHEDGRRVDGPYVSPQWLAFADVAPVVTAPKFKTATLDDFKPGAVFKVEGMTG
jgi:hypothetical protein